MTKKLFGHAGSRHRQVRNIIFNTLLLLIVAGIAASSALSAEQVGWLGINTQALDPKLAKAFGLLHSKGAVVTEVVPGSPAELADLRVGDVIIDYHDERIDSPKQLNNKIRATVPDTHVRIEVVRFGEVRLLRTRIVRHADFHPTTHLKPNPKFDALGIKVLELPLAERIRYGTEHKGVRLQAVEQSSPMAAAGFEPGDIILAIKAKPVTSVQTFMELIDAEPYGRLFPILIQRGHARQFLAAVLPERKSPK